MTDHLHENDSSAEEILGLNPRLKTANPPASTLAEARNLELRAAGLFIIAIISGILFHFSIRAHDYWAAFGAFGVLSICLLGSFKCDDLAKKAKTEKWRTAYRTISYPASKGGVSIIIEIQIELPEKQNTEDTYVQLKNCAVGPLFTLFNSAAITPSHELISDCIERAMALKQLEIDLPLLRMEVIGITENAAPSKPPRTDDVEVGDVIL